MGGWWKWKDFFGFLRFDAASDGHTMAGGGGGVKLEVEVVVEVEVEVEVEVVVVVVEELYEKSMVVADKLQVVDDELWRQRWRRQR